MIIGSYKYRQHINDNEINWINNHQYDGKTVKWIVVYKTDVYIKFTDMTMCHIHGYKYSFKFYDLNVDDSMMFYIPFQ